METRGRPERLHLHLAHRLQRAARTNRRNFDRGLFRLPPLPTERHRALPDRRRISFHERFQHRGLDFIGDRRAAEPARISGEHQRAVGGKHSGHARAPLQLRVVHRLRRGVHRLSRVAEICAEVLNAELTLTDFPRKIVTWARLNR